MAGFSYSTVFDPALGVLAGTHRIQRVPDTEKRGRRQSSEVTVAWLEDTPSGGFRLDPADVREEFIRTSGKGGQNRNKVSSCVRLTHLPTGVQVVADNQRKQAQNRSDAWRRLEAVLRSEHDAGVAKDVNRDRNESASGPRRFTWTAWRDEVKGPSGRTGMRAALAGRLGPLVG